MILPAIAAQSAAIGAASRPAEIAAATRDELAAALRAAKPGDVVVLTAKEYEGGLSAAHVAGAPGRPIIIRSASADAPATFRGGESALHLSGVAYLELRDFTIDGCAANGINIDDGGPGSPPSHHVVIENVRVRGLGQGGNRDGIKLSGVDDFRIAACSVRAWGSGGGSAVDMVGCRRGVLENCIFADAEGDANGVQMKGGSSDVRVSRCRFENAGARAINAGGATGRAYFRPPLAAPPWREASRLVIEDNTIIGSEAAVAFVGADGATFRRNIIYRPRKWAMRILQENAAPEFAPCRDGAVTDNIIIFESARWSEGGVNVGPGVDAASFRFERNFWFCSDAPQRSRPKLPAPETGGVYGAEPKFRDEAHLDLSPLPGSPAVGFGPRAARS